MSETKKAWLVTGCGSGFGRALAEKILARGDCLVAATRRPEVLEELRAGHPETFRAVKVDLESPAQIDALVDQATAAWGRIDILINNAGYGLIGALEETAREQMMDLFEINFFAAVRLMQKVLPQMRARRQGHIINISAAAAIANYPGFSLYGASKAALASVSEALAQETKAFGVKITLIEPGPFRTHFISESLVRGGAGAEEYEGTVGRFAALLQKMDGKQPGDPAKAAEAILAITDVASPPLHLALGKYAIDKVERTCAARLRENESWKQAGLGTEFS